LDLTTQDRDLVAQDQDLDFVRLLATRAQHDQLQHLSQHQVSQRHDHSGDRQRHRRVEQERIPLAVALAQVRKIAAGPTAIAGTGMRD
jgi:hypothetical protein